MREKCIPIGEARSIVSAEGKTTTLCRLLNYGFGLGFKVRVITSDSVQPLFHVLVFDGFNQESDIFIRRPIDQRYVRSLKFVHSRGEARRNRNTIGFIVHTYNIVAGVVKGPRQTQTLGTVDTTQEDGLCNLLFWTW